MKVHIFCPPNDEALSLLKQHLNPDIDLTFGDQTPDSAEFEVLVAGVPPREFIVASPNLKYLIIP